MRYRFGEFILDTGARQLAKNGEEVPLTPKARELLEILIAATPNAVSKEDLHGRLWPSKFVQDASLQTLVAEIREATGDDARAPRFIRTLHGFGYAFADSAEVSSLKLVFADGREVSLPSSDVVLGRDPDCGIWISDASVSRRHARIRVIQGRAILEDMGSKNGTYFRGARILTPTELAPGDEIRLGTVTLFFGAPTRGLSTKTIV